MHATASIARLSLLAVMAAPMLSACRQDGHRDGKPSSASVLDREGVNLIASATDGGLAPSTSTARTLELASALPVLGRPLPLRPPFAANRTVAPLEVVRSTTASEPGGAIARTRTRVVPPSAATALLAAAPTTAVATSPLPARGITRAASFSYGWAISILVPVLALIAWWLLCRHGQRRRGVDRDRVIGWTHIHRPDADGPDSIVGARREVSGAVDTSDVGIPFFPSSATLRYDAARSADERARALSAQIDDAQPLDFHSRYELTAVTLRTMPAASAEAATHGPATLGATSEDQADEAASASATSANQAEPMEASMETTDASIPHIGITEGETIRPAAPATLPTVPPALVSEGAGDCDAPPPGAPEPSVLSGEAWARAGHYWWRLAWRDGAADASALEHAADAFERALALAPEHATLLCRLLSRCHRELAPLTQGDIRTQHLDAALSLFDTHLDEDGVDDATRLDWANALLDRAMVDEGDRRALFEHAARLVDARWDAPARDADAEVQGLHLRLLRARAMQADTLQRAALEEATVAALLRGIERGTSAKREAWLAEWIDLERARMLRMNGAARIAHAQVVQSRAAPLLGRSQSIAPCLAWLRLLGDWAGSLRGDAALRKLAEAGTVFDAIGAIAPETDHGLRFARAYYLRLRANHEVESTRIATLREALRLLSAIDVASLPDVPVRLEAAQAHLALADTVRGPEALADYACAAELAREFEDTSHAQVALTCAISAQLSIANLSLPDNDARAVLEQHAARLLALAPRDARALRLAAEVHVLARRPDEACDTCATGWKVGGDDTGLLSVWRRALDDWAHLARSDTARAAWTRNRQQYRAAATLSP